MLKPYETLTRCQIEVKSCKLPTIDRLQLEMYILRAKRRIVLDQHARLDRTGTAEKEFKDLYDRICKLCGPQGKDGDIRGIISRLQNLMQELETPWPAAKEHGHS